MSATESGFINYSAVEDERRRLRIYTEPSDDPAYFSTHQAAAQPPAEWKTISDELLGLWSEVDDEDDPDLPPKQTIELAITIVNHLSSLPASLSPTFSIDTGGSVIIKFCLGKQEITVEVSDDLSIYARKIDANTGEVIDSTLI